MSVAPAHGAPQAAQGALCEICRRGLRVWQMHLRGNEGVQEGPGGRPEESGAEDIAGCAQGLGRDGPGLQKLIHERHMPGGIQGPFKGHCARQGCLYQGYSAHYVQGLGSRCPPLHASPQC